jgi:hypothetical protein
MSTFHPKLPSEFLADVERRWHCKGVTLPIVARACWSVFAFPLALIFLMSLLATWPAVLDNNAARLGTIAYVVVCPLLSLLPWPNRTAFVATVAVIAIALQLLAVGIVNFWL